ncbi:MAG: nucleoside-diphosphate kinase [Desulfovibrio sp.]|jgi:nucleoside-diphosphate kinase|nr:nucleoside-diphosphate kinase [Desulfovibrio sp.]
MHYRTLCLIKPDAVERGLSGAILDMIQNSDLKIIAMKMLRLTQAEAEGFYTVHKERPFFDSLTRYMSSGPIVAAVLEGEDAVARYRALMGATNPADAQDGTIRKRYAVDVEANAVHGSDAPETASIEISYFFSALDLAGWPA